jgi:hypothetical protein
MRSARVAWVPLADAGHQTFSAATTQEALAIIEANAVSLDILFVDIGLALRRRSLVAAT